MASVACMSSSSSVKSSVKKTTIRPKKKTPTTTTTVSTQDIPESVTVTPTPTPPPPSLPAAPSIPVMTSPPKKEPYCDPSLFTQQQIKRKLTVPFYKIKQGVDVKQLLTTELANQLEGRCSIEGYICPYSITIRSYSCGTLAAGNIVFDILADCLICFPDEHSVIKCVVRTITQAGIRAGALYLQPGHVSPIEVFLSRDMNIKKNELFSRIEENDILTVEIIGRRFVLHDTHVTVIAMLLDAESPPQ